MTVQGIEIRAELGHERLMAANDEAEDVRWRDQQKCLWWAHGTGQDFIAASTRRPDPLWPSRADPDCVQLRPLIKHA